MEQENEMSLEEFEKEFEAWMLTQDTSRYAGMSESERISAWYAESEARRIQEQQ
jgi:hypothetical protein